MKESQTSGASNASGMSIDPELLQQDPQAFKQALMAQIRARGGTSVVDTKSVFQDLIKQTLEAFLEVEMERRGGIGDVERQHLEPMVPGQRRPSAGLRMVAATRHPRSANRFAAARPMPDDAPVMRTTGDDSTDMALTFHQATSDKGTLSCGCRPSKAGTRSHDSLRCRRSTPRE